MNKYFDFSKGQLKFLTILSVVLVFLAGYRLIQAYAYHADDTLDLPVTFTTESGYSGVFTLDPNTAPVDSLELLPGIGPVLADRIVAYRQETLFVEPIDITNVTGIGPRLYERLKPFLQVRRR